MLAKDSDLFKYEDVDYLEVEVLRMPVIGLSNDYLWRFNKPFKGVLNTTPIKIMHVIGNTNNKVVEEILKERLLEKWIELVNENHTEVESLHPKTKDMINKWKNITEVKIKYLELTAKEEAKATTCF